MLGGMHKQKHRNKLKTFSNKRQSTPSSRVHYLQQLVFPAQILAVHEADCHECARPINDVSQKPREKTVMKRPAKFRLIRSKRQTGRT